MPEITSGSVRANDIDFHYLEAGQGPLVLCMHGFPDHLHSFRALLPELAQAGYRGVAPFMRGYYPTGPAPDGRYQSLLMSQDVLAIIDALGSERAVLVGHDWGARAVFGATILAPERVTKLVTLGSSHPAAGQAMSLKHHFLKGTWHMFYFQLPAAERAIAHDDYAFIEDWIRDSAPDWDVPRDMIEGVKDTYRRPGVLDAVLAYYRHNVNPALQDPALKELQQHVSTAPITVPTLAFHGSPERPGRLEVFHGMDRFFTGGLEKVVVEGAGHFVHQEKPDEVNPRIVEFLGR